MEECEWCSTSADEYHFHTTIRDVRIQRALRGQGMQVLGSRICVDNTCSVDVTLRLQKARGAFYHNRDLLCSKGNLRRRLQLLQTIVFADYHKICVLVMLTNRMLMVMLMRWRSGRRKLHHDEHPHGSNKIGRLKKHHLEKIPPL